MTQDFLNIHLFYFCPVQKRLLPNASEYATMPGTAPAEDVSVLTDTVGTDVNVMTLIVLQIMGCYVEVTCAVLFLDYFSMYTIVRGTCQHV